MIILLIFSVYANLASHDALLVKWTPCGLLLAIDIIGKRRDRTGAHHEKLMCADEFLLVMTFLFVYFDTFTEVGRGRALVSHGGRDVRY